MEQPSANIRRKVLSNSVGTLLNEIGFDSCEKMALETLTEMLQCFITETGELARTYCELTGRTEPLISDVQLALIDMGIKTNGIEQFAKRSNRTVLPSPQIWQPQKQMSMLQAGIKQPHPNHVPHYFPDFPHPHAYIRTPTHKQPVTEYEAIREKAATQKRDMERALTKFLARTGPTNNLFQSEEANIYPLIACKRLYPPYISSLLPQDQIFDPEDLEYDPRDDPVNTIETTDDNTTAENRKRSKSETNQSDVSNNENENDETIDGPKENETSPTNTTQSKPPPPLQSQPESNNNNNNTGNPDIDNPYLRATKMPRKKIITKINVMNNTSCSTVE